MKRREPKSVGQIIAEAIAATGMESTFREQQAAYIWGEIAGPTVNRLTTRRYVERGVLHVYISSAPLKQELSFYRDRLAARVNEALGANIITDIVFH